MNRHHRADERALNQAGEDMENRTQTRPFPEWRHKDLWTVRGRDFAVEVSRHTESPDEDRGEHRWAVYVYVYPAHPYFAAFDGDSMWQDAATALPLHSYPSFLRWHRNDAGEPTSVQVGADYNHLYDTHFTHYATREDAAAVFADAKRLWAFMEEAREQPCLHPDAPCNCDEHADTRPGAAEMRKAGR